MPQPHNQDPERGIDGHLNHPPLAQFASQPSQGESNFGDSSAPLFTMYSKIAEEEDNKMAERWQKDADGIIIFNGLFSAVVATLVSVSIQDIRPNSQDTSAFYLKEMYQLQANPNISPSSTPFAVTQPPSFSPPTYAVWVNSLWFLSFVISLTCAMLATSLQQWARRYLRMTRPARCSPHKRARVRAFFANGVDKFCVTWVVEVLPALVHLSLFIFFAGLLIYLFNINHTVFTMMAHWMGLLSAVYICITLMPSFLHESPYNSPLSSTIWFLCTLILCTVYLVIYIFIKPSIGINNETPPLFALPMGGLLGWFVGGVEGEVEKAASKGSSEIDSRIVEWTINALSEDDAIEAFAEAIPGFYRSSVVKGLRRTLPIQVEGRILIPMRSFLDRTLSSNSVSAPVKIRRLTICLNAASELGIINGVECLLSSMPLGNWQGVPHSIEIAHFLTSWSKANPGQFPLLIRGINARILLSARERDGHWFALVMECLRVPERVLQDYLAHEDSLQLACLILFCRYALDAHYRVRGDLQPLCEIDICNTLPGLQHEFCSVWNQLVQATQNRGRYNKNPYDVVIQIRHLYASLHPGTDAAPTALTQPSSALFSDIRQHLSTYPSCNIPGHRYDLMPHNHGLSAAEAPYHSTAADYSTSSSTAISDLPSVLAAATSIPQPAFTPLSDSTIDLRPTGSTDHPPLSPSTVPRMSSSPSPTLPAIDTLPMDLRSFPPSSSQSNQVPPDAGLHLPNSSTTIPLILSQGPSVSDTAVALNIEALGAPDDSRGLDDPTSCEAHSLSTSDGVICT